MTAKLTSFLTLLLPLAITAGCAAVPQGELPDNPEYAPMLPQSPRPDFNNQGGVSYARFGTSLFSDRRALDVGDIVTVVLQERTQASKDATTDISKDSDLGMSASNPLFGATPPFNGFDPNGSVSANRSFGGDASSTQSNSLNGQITVSVVEVMPNGLLRVRGEKWMQLNRGQEYIRLTGIMRQEDIQPNNSVPSSKLADVRISYSGEGELAQSNNMGWLGKFFNSGWWPL